MNFVDKSLIIALIREFKGARLFEGWAYFDNPVSMVRSYSRGRLIEALRYVALVSQNYKKGTSLIQNSI